VARLQQAGIRLGISTHSPYEIARAHAYRPSYMAFGPIFETKTKAMPFAPQGMELLKTWCVRVPYPVVAIGGLAHQHYEALQASGASGWAVISAIRDAISVEDEIKSWC
jgi:hydroxymethylpyrimidine kinase/phosphomethylpyrimidine kinase/thiamine-phosphate diphosphorylase